MSDMQNIINTKFKKRSILHGSSAILYIYLWGLSMHPSLLHANGLAKCFGKGNQATNVLRDVTATFTQGMSYAITGVSGTGKSTLMHILVGLDAPTSGAVFFNNTNIYQMNSGDRSHFLQRSVGLMFQLPYLIRELSVLENVMLPGLISRRAPDECKAQAMKLLSDVAVANKAEHKPASLSGGQQQRVALARALLNEPALLFADEPTGNLDERTAQEMVELLVRLQTEWHMGLIVSTHDTYVARQMQHQYRLHDGMLHSV